MKKVEKFQCELCNEIYETKEATLNCEEKGKETPLAKINQTVDYEMKVGEFDSFYVPLRVSQIEDLGHYLVYHFEEYDEVAEDWFEFIHRVWGNDEFKEKVKLKMHLLEG